MAHGMPAINFFAWCNIASGKDGLIDDVEGTATTWVALLFSLDRPGE
jgi:hypothetical protein